MKKIVLAIISLILICNHEGVSQTTLDSGLVGFFPFSGNAADSSGLSNSGSVNGAILADDRFGNPNSAYWFDGIDDYIIINSYTQMSPISEVSVSAWIKTDQSPGGAYTAIYDRLQANDGFALVIRPNGTIRFSVNGGLGIATSSQTVLDNKWHFVAGTYNKNTGQMQVYIDCNQDGQSTYNSDITYSPEPRNSIGGPGGLFDSFFYGSMDELRVYNREIDFSDISDLCIDTLSTISLNERVGLVSDISTYPNPTSGLVYIEGAKRSNMQVFIYNASGSFISKSSYNASSEVKILNMNSLKAGMYFLEIITDEGRVAKKVSVKN